MSAITLQQCAIKTAVLNLVGEKVLTRVAITESDIDEYAKPIRLPPGDPKLTHLSQIIHTLKLEQSIFPRFELRLLIHLKCMDGRSHVIAGSRTQPDGLMYISVDGTVMTTRSPFRHQLDVLVGAAEGAAHLKSYGKTTIGVATQEVDGTIVLSLRGSTNGIVAEEQVRYPPSDPRYASIEAHVGPIPIGGSVPVKPF